MSEIIVEFEIYPTENEEKVINGIKSIFPSLDFSFSKNDVKFFSGKTEDEDIIRKIEKEINLRKLNREAIIKKRNGYFEVLLNKQAICVKKLRFLEEEQTLGAIRIKFYPS